MNCGRRHDVWLPAGRYLNCGTLALFGLLFKRGQRIAMPPAARPVHLIWNPQSLMPGTERPGSQVTCVSARRPRPVEVSLRRPLRRVSPAKRANVIERHGVSHPAWRRLHHDGCVAYCGPIETHHNGRTLRRGWWNRLGCAIHRRDDEGATWAERGHRERDRRERRHRDGSCRARLPRWLHGRCQQSAPAGSGWSGRPVGLAPPETAAFPRRTPCADSRSAANIRTGANHRSLTTITVV
jgi:hypothetical protein